MRQDLGMKRYASTNGESIRGKLKREEREGKKERLRTEGRLELREKERENVTKRRSFQLYPCVAVGIEDSVREVSDGGESDPNIHSRVVRVWK